MNPEFDEQGEYARYFPPGVAPGDLVAIQRNSIIFKVGDRGWIERINWSQGRHICVVQLFEKPGAVRILVEDLLKISNT